MIYAPGMEIEDIARVCHEANRTVQAIQNDPAVPVSKAWAHETHDVRESAIWGVEGVLAGNGPEQSHEGWCEVKREQGWVYGEKKDPSAKTHPCLVPYDELPPEYRLKDALFVSIVHALAG